MAAEYGAHHISRHQRYDYLRVRHDDDVVNGAYTVQACHGRRIVDALLVYSS